MYADLLTYSQFLQQVNARLAPDKQIKHYQLRHAVESDKFSFRGQLIGHNRCFLLSQADEAAAYFDEGAPAPGRKSKRRPESKIIETLLSPHTQTPLASCEGRELDAWFHGSMGHYVDFARPDESNVPQYTRNSSGIGLAYSEFWKNNYNASIVTAKSPTENIRRLIAYLHDAVGKEYSQRQAALYKSQAGGEACSQPPKFKGKRKRKKK